MATKQKTTGNVTRVKATSSKATPKAAAKATTKPKAHKATAAVKPAKKSNKLLATISKPFISFGGYLKGSWFELRQVHWPNRKATWNLTSAVILFSLFFAVMILLLDAAFKYLFELILS